ncbi:hypothetical protein BDV95DRAFT_183372 [Massariosphaeria phaeospora]|uniref:Uncharacterized protein n=1 Tax=Massariosphaeria phaeospora TaxID=100035 RepID=A0A7C8I084_9PLEO|nr:hypothetical protein BDV95DRAFT_183372 [Massariosphaeria phaeospora]
MVRAEGERWRMRCAVVDQLRETGAEGAAPLVAVRRRTRSGGREIETEIAGRWLQCIKLRGRVEAAAAADGRRRRCGERGLMPHTRRSWLKLRGMPSRPLRGNMGVTRQRRAVAESAATRSRSSRHSRALVFLLPQSQESIAGTAASSLQGRHQINASSSCVFCWSHGSESNRIALHSGVKCLGYSILGLWIASFVTYLRPDNRLPKQYACLSPKLYREGRVVLR